MKKLVLYVHGQGGSPAEAARYQPLFPDAEVVGLDYHAQTPWEARKEFPRLVEPLLEARPSVTLIANSLGAYFAMSSLDPSRFQQAFLISPVVDMARLIGDMMGWAGVTESELREQGEISTDFGQTLSWDYLTYARAHPVHWNGSTHILYGGTDHLTSRATITDFARNIGATLTVLEDGAHWFHTAEQMAALDQWIRFYLH